MVMARFLSYHRKIRQEAAEMPDQPRFDLYVYWRTSAGYRVRVALNLKGLTATERFINLDAGDQRSEAFLAINPLGGVPALVVDGGPVLTQSLAILEYLDEIAPAPPLLPQDPIGRARVRSICSMLAADTHPFITPRVRKYLTAQAGFDPVQWKAWQTNWFTTGLQAVERRLAGDPATGAFCHGDRVTVADIVLASIPAVMQVFGVTVPGIPTVDRIVAACWQLPAFAAADPYRQAGAPAAA
jgi:maleylacetoacetate isomerase